MNIIVFLGDKKLPAYGYMYSDCVIPGMIE